MGFIKSVGSAVIYIGLFLTVITFIPGLPPEAEFSEYSIITAGDVKQPFELQNNLRGAEVLFSGELKGPESFDSYAGELYTTLQGGYVAKIDEKHIIPVAKFGKQCDGIWQEDKCGRPLGLKFNDKGDLFVVDTYYGIFKLNIKTGQYKLAINTSEPINGKIPKTPNSIDIAKNGDIYWTDSSSDFHLYDGVYTGLANPSGRLFKYNAATKKNEVLLDKLDFANGVKLSEDESFVIVLETWSSRIIKYNLKGSKAGQSEIFAEALPGLPDNVHSDEQGGFLVSLISYVDAEHPMLPQSLIPHPFIRKMLARLMYLMEAPLKMMNDVYPNTYAERLIHSIGSFEGFGSLVTIKQSVILRMDVNGKVLDAIYSNDGTVDMVCSAYIHNDYLWLGSPFAERILRVPLEKAFPNLVKSKQHTVHVREKRDAESIAKKSEGVKVESTIKEQKTRSNSASQKATPTPAPATTTPKPTSTIPKPKAVPIQKPAVTTTGSKSASQGGTPTPAPTTTTPKPTSTNPKQKAVPVQKPVTTGKSASQGGTPTPAPATTTSKPTSTNPTPKVVPKQKPAAATVTSEKSRTATKPATEKPMSDKRTPTRDSNEQRGSAKDALKNRVPSIPPPPPPSPSPSIQKSAPIKKDASKISSNEKIKSKTETPKSKSEQPSKTKSAEGNSKPKKSNEENVRESDTGKVKVTDKNRPKDTSKTN